MLVFHLPDRVANVFVGHSTSESRSPCSCCLPGLPKRQVEHRRRLQPHRLPHRISNQHQTPGETGSSQWLLHPRRVCSSKEVRQQRVPCVRWPIMDIQTNLRYSPEVCRHAEREVWSQTERDCGVGLYELHKFYLLLVRVMEPGRHACLYQLQLDWQAIDALGQGVNGSITFR